MASEATWQLQDAKNRLSELIRRARMDEPQVITVRGEEVVAIIPIEEYRRHHPRPRSGKSLLDVLRANPLGEFLSDEEIDELFARDPDPGRDIDLD
jgi:prevent-host-death family protein